MKNKTNPIVVTCSSLALASALIFWTPTQAQPAATAPGSSPSSSVRPSTPSPATPAPSVSGSKAGERAGAMGQDMQEHHRKLQEQAKAEDTALNAQVTAMNRAPDDRKVALMAAIITTMVEQRAAANVRMGMMAQPQPMNRDAAGQPALPAVRDAAPKATAPYTKGQE